MKKESGFTLLELLIVLVIMGILFSISLTAFVSYRKQQSLIKDTDLVVETLREARNLTMVSKDAQEYGVHFDDYGFVLYIGPTYSSGQSTNKSFSLSPNIMIERNIPGGGSEILFNRISGEANVSSSASIKLVLDEQASTTVKIYQTGTVERINQ